jgi:hypothetical protein
MMALDDSSYGMSDNSGLVTPPACVGVIFGAEHRVYADTGFQEMRDQTFRPETYVVDDVIQPPYVVEQTVVVYATAQQAQAALTASQNQWSLCAKGAVTERLPPEDSRDWVLGAVIRSGDLVTVPMAANSHIGPAACQRALGARDNVVVGTRRCDYWEGSATTAFTGSEWPTDRNWASDDAGRLAQLMPDRAVI